MKENLGAMARRACTWEARARKAGNVTPEHAFADLTVADFYRSAEAIAPVFERAAERPIGVTVLQAVEATRRVTASNTNLGIVLLLAPLAKVPAAETLHQGVEQVLAALTVDDSRRVFEAIRLANPGGLGEAPEQDVRGTPTLPLREIMALAAERDLVARQYANDFREVLDEGTPAFLDAVERFGVMEDAIIWCQLTLLARHPDTLIARKVGSEEAEEASRRAGVVLAAGWPTASAGRQAFAELDAWLREDGNARNPGATADLVTACLFAALRENRMTQEYPWARDSHHEPAA